MAETAEQNLQELIDKLTPNQRIFCDEYLKDRNGSRSYLVAYKSVKKEASAEQGASRLLSSNVKVKAYIDYQLDKLSSETGITVKRILKEEGCLAFSDLRLIFNGISPIAPSDLPEEIARALAGFEIIEKPIFDNEGKFECLAKTYKYKFWDKGRSLERLGRHLKMYTDRVEISNLDELSKRLSSAHKKANGSP